MRKVSLSMKAQEKYDVIKRLAEGHISIKTAAVKIGCTGRKPVRAFSEELKQEIVSLYNRKYWDTNFTHCCELLERNDSIRISPSSLRKILYNEFVLSPRANRRTRKQMNKLLRDMHKAAKTKKEKALIEASIVNLSEAHSRRSRCAYFGEMLQMDASLHLWFGDCKSQLHVAIDDCTGRIVGAYFDHQETLNGYYHVLHQILTNYGIPNMLYTDNRTVFEYKNKK